MNTLGETLKRERLRQGWEIKDIEESISIRGLYLNAIEEGNYKVVPGEVYLKGFIRNYAIHLGLDPQDMLELYRQDKETVPPEERLSEEKTLPVAKPREPGTKVRKYQRRREEKREDRGKSFPISKWQVLFLVVIGAIIWGMMNFSGLRPAPLPAEPPGQSKSAPASPGAEKGVNNPAAQPQNTVQPPPATAGPVAAPPAESTQAAGKNVTVTIKFTGKCWTQVNVDGNLAYEGTPKVGESLVFSGDRRVFMRLGNAGAVELSHNGKNLGRAGKIGEVVIKTFGKDSETSVTSQ